MAKTSPSNAGGTGSIPGWRTKDPTCHRATKPKGPFRSKIKKKKDGAHIPCKVVIRIKQDDGCKVCSTMPGK